MLVTLAYRKPLEYIQINYIQPGNQKCIFIYSMSDLVPKKYTGLPGEKGVPSPSSILISLYRSGI